MVRSHFLENIARLSSSYISCDVYHEAGKALEAVFSSVGKAEGSPLPRYFKTDGAVAAANKVDVVQVRKVKRNKSRR